MIGLLRGALLEKRPGQVILDAGGVGYEVRIPLSTFSALGALHAQVTLLIHTHVREDQISLFGFLSAREKHLFELLLSVSGLGPAIALRILSGMSADEIIPAARRRGRTHAHQGCGPQDSRAYYRRAARQIRRGGIRDRGTAHGPLAARRG